MTILIFSQVVNLMHHPLFAICQDLHQKSEFFNHCIGTFLSPENYIQLGQNRCPVKFPKNSERILPHCVFRSIFYACVVKGDFFSTSIPCASLVGTQWIFICFFALNFSYFFPEIGRHLFLLFYCYVTSAQRFILQRSRTRLVKIWQLLFQCFLFDFCR